MEQIYFPALLREQKLLRYSELRGGESTSVYSFERPMDQRYFPALLRLPRLSIGGESFSTYSFERPMDQRYLPAILPTTLHDRWGINPLNWMNPILRGTPAYYPYALLSYYHWKQAEVSFEPDVLVFGDSGGYSVATLGARISAVDAIRWQIHNCQVGVILDVPPYLSVGSAVLGGDASSNWDAALKKTIRNVRNALPLYEQAKAEGHPFRWWGVVHGETWEQMKEWYQRISEIYPFTEEGEGWAMKPHPANDPRSVARCLGFLRDAGIKRAHFLQMTGLPATTTLFVLGPQAGLEYATYDSATPSFVGINRTIMVPNPEGMNFFILSEKYREKGETFARDTMRDWCECPSCDFLREDMEAGAVLDEEYWKYRMIFHNTLTLVDILAKRFEEAQTSPDELLRHTLGRVPEGLLAEQGRMQQEGRELNLYGATLRAYEGREAHFVSLGTPKSLLDWID